MKMSAVFQVCAKGKLFFEQHTDKRVKKCGFADAQKRYGMTLIQTL